MAATSPVDSVWTPETMKLCRLSSRRPQVVSLCHLVVTVIPFSHPKQWDDTPPMRSNPVAPPLQRPLYRGRSH